MKTTKTKSAYSYPKTAKFCMCFKAKGMKGAFYLIDITPSQAKYFLSHFPADYYWINDGIKGYVLINVLLDKVGN